MTSLAKNCCPLSEDFFYWPPEEIAQYKNWCEIGQLQHKRRFKKVKRDNQGCSQDHLMTRSEVQQALKYAL